MQSHHSEDHIMKRFLPDRILLEDIWANLIWLQ